MESSYGVVVLQSKPIALVDEYNASIKFDNATGQV